MKHLRTLLASLTILSLVVFLLPEAAFASQLGYTSIGASDWPAGTQNGIANPTGLLITVPSTGTISKITAYVDETVSSASLTAALRNGSAGSRGSVVATTNGGTVTTSFGWVDFTFSSPVSVSAGTYWIEFSGDGGGGPGTNVAHQKYDTGGAANTGYDILDNGTPSFETNQYSMYATFTASGGGSTPATHTKTIETKTKAILTKGKWVIK